MPKFAEIEKNENQEVFVKCFIDTDANPEFDPAILREFKDLYVELNTQQAKEVEANWLYDGRVFTPPPPPPEPSLDELKEMKLAEIKQAYENFEATGTVTVSLGYPIQCGQLHAQKFDGAVRYAEQMNQDTIYITDANDETHYDVPIADAKKALLEVTAQSLKAHALKQTLRSQVEAAQSKEDIEAIKWNLE